MILTRLYPGMCDTGLEIFFNHSKDELMAIKNGKVQKFEELKENDTLL